MVVVVCDIALSATAPAPDMAPDCTIPGPTPIAEKPKPTKNTKVKIVEDSEAEAVKEKPKRARKTVTELKNNIDKLIPDDEIPDRIMLKVRPL